MTHTPNLPNSTSGYSKIILHNNLPVFQVFQQRQGYHQDQATLGLP